MAEIFKIILAKNHEAKLRFNYGGAALPGGSSVLSVRDGSGGQWKFNCRSEGGNSFSISGAGWWSFAGTRIDRRLIQFFFIFLFFFENVCNF